MPKLKRQDHWASLLGQNNTSSISARQGFTQRQLLNQSSPALLMNSLQLYLHAPLSRIPSFTLYLFSINIICCLLVCNICIWHHKTLGKHSLIHHWEARKNYCPWIIDQKTVAERLYDLLKAVKPDSFRSCSFPKSALGLLILTCLTIFKHLFYQE